MPSRSQATQEKANLLSKDSKESHALGLDDLDTNPVSERALKWFAEAELDQVRDTMAVGDLGLSTDSVKLRLKHYGPNVLLDPDITPIWRRIVDQFIEPLVLVLVVACIFSMVLGEYADAIAIFLIIFANTLIGVLQEARAENALAALKELTDNPSCRCIRDGREVVVRNSQLVPGDIVIFESGDSIPADLRLMSAVNLTCDQSSLTGESVEVSKHPMSILDQYDPNEENYWQGAEHKEESTFYDNICYMGCSVQGGKGTGIILRTGMKTEVGQLAQALNDIDQEPSPLESALHTLGIHLGMFCLVVCALVFLVGFLTKRGADLNSEQPVWIQMFLVAVALAVAAVPEGLPVCVTITLAIGMRDMIKRKALIRNLHSVETLGSTSVICTDKTGTITRGEMSAVRVWSVGSPHGVGAQLVDDDDVKDAFLDVPRALQITAGANECDGKFASQSIDIYRDGAFKLDSSANDLVAEGNWHKTPLLIGLLCSNVKMDRTNNRHGLTYMPVGNSTECAIVLAAMKAGLDMVSYQAEYPRLEERPFSSARKMMSCLVKNKLPPAKNRNGRRAHRIIESARDQIVRPFGNIDSISCVKGAPDRVVQSCKSICNTDGKVRPLTERDRSLIMSAVEMYGGEQAFRVIALAYRTFNNERVTQDDMETNLTFAGLVALADPVRPEVKPSLQIAKQAGIRTVMITGDYLATAKAVAVDIGLLQQSETSLKAIDCGILRDLKAQISHVVQRKAQLQSEGFNNVALMQLEQELEGLIMELDNLIASKNVFARANPLDKLTIVTSIQRNGHIVAVTGDGTNDAPALKKADIGIAMGLNGKDIARAASDMILMDDDFASIVAAVEQGRIIYDNIWKFVYYLLSCNVAEIMVIFLCVLIGVRTPLTPIQLLWLNLVTDAAPALALAMEKGMNDIMLRGPRGKGVALMNGLMFLGILVQMVVLTAVVLFAYFYGLYDTTGDWFGHNDTMSIPEREEAFQTAQTMAYLSLSMAELVRAYTVRSPTISIFRYGFCSNLAMQIGVFASATLCIGVANVPGIMDLFGCNYLTSSQWTVTLSATIVPAIVDELLKLILCCTNLSIAGTFTKEEPENSRVLESSHQFHPHRL